MLYFAAQNLDLTNFGILCYHVYMSTINISLPSRQVSLIDEFVKRYGFANRSEFVRAVIRLITRKPEIVDYVSLYPFVSPKTQSIKAIISDFKKTKKYSSKPKSQC